ncbi:MAG: hypothetical protein Q4G64_10400, partial [bacterium]|nr:hypothetical protein [bacterium]
MVAAMERALEETGAGPIRFAIGSLSGNRATFDCALPTLTDELAEMLTEGFRGNWVFTLTAPLTEGQALSDVAPEDRTLNIRLRTPRDGAGQILSKVPGAWEFGASAAETLGWDYATMEVSGEWLIEGLVPLWPGTVAHDDFYDFWMSWSRYGAELVQTTTNAHPALTPNSEGGVDIHIEYLPVAEGLTEEQERLLGIYVAKLEEMGLAPVNVSIVEGAA